MLHSLHVVTPLIFTLLTPLAARLDTGYLIALRVAEGLGEGVTFPAMNAMIAKWCPFNERSRYISIIYTGSLIGTVLSQPATGYLCLYGFAGGWPSVFYVFGGLGIIWFIFWIIFAYDSPETHPRISAAERFYIQSTSNYSVQKFPIPWKDILTSLPLWSIAICHFGSGWGFYTLLIELPTYMQTILNFDLQKSSLLSALPYLTSSVSSILVSYVCDKLIEKNYNLTAVRKIFNSIGLIIPAGLFVAVTFVGCDSTLTFTILILVLTINSGVNGGFLCNHIDIAPNFAGTLFGITNTISNCSGWMVPAIVGVLTQGKPYRRQWNIVFYIAAGWYFISAIAFNVFGKTNEQAWNKPQKEVLTSNGVGSIYQNGIQDHKHEK